MPSTDRFVDHELAIQRIAKEIGFPHVSLSSQLLPMIKMTSRGASATADAYLTPVIRRYIDSFRSGFADGLRSGGTRCEFMQSDGGLVNFEKFVPRATSRFFFFFFFFFNNTSFVRFSGLRAILSGPAGGVVGQARTSFDESDATPIIGYV